MFPSETVGASVVSEMLGASVVVLSDVIGDGAGVESVRFDALVEIIVGAGVASKSDVEFMVMLVVEFICSIVSLVVVDTPSGPTTGDAFRVAV